MHVCMYTYIHVTKEIYSYVNIKIYIELFWKQLYTYRFVNMHLK